MRNAPRTASRTRLLIAFVATLFAVSVFLHQMYFAPRAQATGTGSTSLTTLGSAYLQDFNTLAITGTANTSLPLGWYLTESGGGARDNEAYAADNGASGTGDTYSYGATGNTERAFGGLLSGTLTPILGASFTNNTGSTISQLNISYMGEQWRLGALARLEQIDFQYSNDATSLDTGAWTDVNTLDFASPVSTGTVGALNGNVPPNRTLVSSSITGLSIPIGATFWIRWMDFNAAGADDGLSVDDFSLTPIFVPIPTNPTGTGLANPATVTAGGSTLLTVAVTPGANPTSTGLAVTCNLIAIGGSASQVFFDNNTNGDVTTGDNTFSFQATVDSGTSEGAKNLPCTITDNYPRSGNATIALTVQSPPPPAGSVVVSQVYGGGGNAGATYKNDFIELYNRTISTISLAGWSVQYAAAAGSSWQVTLLSGSIEPGKYYLVQEAAGAGGTLNLPAPDATGSIPMAATAGKVALVNNSIALSGTCPSGSNISDFVGYGSANCFEGGGAAPTLSNTTAALRLSDGAQDTDNNNVDFVAGAPNPRNSHDPAPAVSSTIPLSGAAGVTLNGNITINFSEPVNVTGTWFTISCATSGSHSATVSGGPTTFVLNPDTNFVSLELCTVTVVASQVTDQDTDDPPDTMAANHVFSFTTREVLVCGDPATRIHDIQGSGTSSPLIGTSNVVIEGVVVGDYQNTTTQLSGFHVQEEDADADADPATSEGIFVFDNGFGVDVNPGDVVRVRGTVSEFSDLTELSSVNVVQVCSSGNSVTAANVNLPVTNLNDWERFESMLVNIPQDLTATETFTLGRFGEVSLSVNGRLRNPTNIVAPGAPAIAQQDLNDRSRILLDDGNGQQNIDPTIHPTGGLSAANTLRSGYTVHGLSGVLEQRFGVYRVQPVGPVSFDASTNLRTPAPSPVGGNLKVAALNVLNFFTTLDVGTPICGPTGGLDCRGANSAFEFTRQRDKIINAILAINPDIAGLMEVQNDATATIQNLVDGLNAVAGAGTYTYINTGTIGTDAIKVALIYKPASVTPVGAYAILDSSVNPLFLDTKNRPTLAQTFMRNANSSKLTVVVNHLKSKGSACNDVGDPDTGDGQGNCNLTRNKAATALVSWLAGDPTGSGDPDFLVVGDMNSYAKEDPITTIKNGGYTNLLEILIGADAYSYVFDGQSGYLDHALASSSLNSQVAGVTEWHNNADEPTVLDYNVEFKTANQINTFYTSEPYRASDHDPVVVGLNLNDPPTVDAGGPYSVAEGGSVLVTATGNDPNTGETLTYAWDLDNNGSFETSGQSAIFSAAGLDGPTSRTIKVHVTDNSGFFAVDEATVNVLNVSPSITSVTNNGPINEGSSATITVNATDPAGASDPLSYEFDCNNDLSYEVGPQSGNSAPCSFSDNGSYVVGVRVSDGDGGTTTGSTTVIVNNVAPTVSASFSPSSVSCGANNATLNVSFTDPGTADTHTAVINWGDGNTQNVNPATSPFSRSHTYAAAGMYTATVDVTDDDGGVGTTTAMVAVKFNTSGFLQPINADGTSVFKYNSTIPVKISFTNCNGSIPNNLAPTIRLTMISGATPGLEINEPISTSAADTTGVMRFSSNQYIYNLATKPLPDSSATYLITVTIPSNGQTETVQFGLKP